MITTPYVFMAYISKPKKKIQVNWAWPPFFEGTEITQGQVQVYIQLIEEDCQNVF